MRAPAGNGAGGLTPEEHAYALESFRLVGKRLRAERLGREHQAEQGDDMAKEPTRPPRPKDTTDGRLPKTIKGQARHKPAGTKPAPPPAPPPRGRASAGRTMAGLPDRVTALASEVDHLETSGLASRRHLQQAIDELSTVLACVVAELLRVDAPSTDDAQVRAERLAFLDTWSPRIGRAHRHLVDTDAPKPTDAGGA